MHEQVLPAGQIVEQFGCDRLIYVPETNEDAEIVRYAKQWELSFEGRGLRISTGPVVMFRVAEFLQASHHVGVPLLSSHNVKRFATIWPVVKAKWPLAFADSDRSKKHLVPVRNYVLLKRFSAKEERRRLTAGCIFRRAFPFERVAIENHLNYVYHFERELTVDETWGITAIFNSVLFDRYFRTLSGNTQVNSTEIRNLHFPDIPTIARIGSRIRRTKKELLRKSEHIVLEELGINGSLRRYLEAKAE
jgi:adenine-specific DNA-methyltransferase